MTASTIASGCAATAAWKLPSCVRAASQPRRKTDQKRMYTSISSTLVKNPTK